MLIVISTLINTKFLEGFSYVVIINPTWQNCKIQNKFSMTVELHCFYLHSNWFWKISRISDYNIDEYSLYFRSSKFFPYIAYVLNINYIYRDYLLYILQILHIIIHIILHIILYILKLSHIIVCVCVSETMSYCTYFAYSNPVSTCEKVLSLVVSLFVHIRYSREF